MAKRTFSLDTKEIQVIVDSLESGAQAHNSSGIALIKKLKGLLKTIKVRSAKAKGMSFQKEIAEVIAQIIDIPVEKDGLIESRGSGQHGTDIVLRGEARQRFPFSIECKCQESLDLVGTIGQAKENTMDGTDWLVVHRRKALKEDVVIMSVDAFIGLFNKGRK